MTATRTSCLLALAMGAGVAHARDLSYTEALDQALQRNPDLMKSGLDLESADGALMAAKGTFDPTFTSGVGMSGSTGESTQQFGEVLSQYSGLEVKSGVSWFAPTGTSASLDWRTNRSKFKYELRDSGIVVESEEPVFETRLAATISQPLLEGHRMSWNLQGVRAANQARDQATAEQRRVHQQILADVAKAYWSLWTAQKLAQISEQAVAIAEEEARVVHAKVAEGSLAPVERSRVDAAVVQSKSARLEAQLANRQANDVLLLLLGEMPGEPLTLGTAPRDPVALSIDAEATVKAALENNPSMQALRLSFANAEASLSDARHGRLPELSAVATYGLSGFETSHSDAVGELFSGDLPEWYLGANLSVPLGNRADRGAILSSQADLGKARIDLSTLERSLAQQVLAQVDALEAARLKVELALANLRFAEQTLAGQRALQAAGRAIQKDVLETIQAVDDARVGAERARADFQVAVVELERLKGSL